MMNIDGAFNETMGAMQDGSERADTELLSKPISGVKAETMQRSNVYNIDLFSGEEAKKLFSDGFGYG